MKLNKKMKRILAFVLSLAMVVSTFGLNVVSADDEWVSTNNGWINFTEDGYVTGDVNRYAVEGISAIYAGVWDDGKTANIDVLRNAETPNSLAIDVKDNTHDDQWLVQVACNVKGLDSTKVYKVELKLDGTTVLDTANVSSAEKYEKIVGIGNNEALTVGKHTLTLETEELVKGDTPVEVKNIEITPNEAQIAATRKIFANWTNPEGTAKAYAYLEEAKEENGVCTDGKGWAFNVSAAQPMTSVDNVSRTYSDTDTITVEAGKTYKFIVESFNAFGDKTGEGSVDITIPAKTQEEIDACDGIIIAADKNVEMARFDGKPVIKVKVSDGIHKSQELIERAVKGDGPIYHHEGGKAASTASEGDESFGRQIYKHLMNGVSNMLPFVIGGGILIAIAFLLDDYSIDPSNFGMNTPMAAFFKTAGGVAFNFMLPILAGFIAMSIADRPGLMVGFAGGAIASAGTTFASCFNSDITVISGGFLGALFAGFLAGYLVLALEKITEKMPSSMDGLRPMLIYPVAGLLLISVIMFAINPFFSWLNQLLADALNSLSGTNSILLGLIVGGMMSIDMGGPFNKAAYVFGTASLAYQTDAGYMIMAAVMVGGMVPPIAIAIASWVFKNKFTDNDRKTAPVNAIMGLCFISEAAIPFAAGDPLHVIPPCVIGSAVAGALSMAFKCTLMAPHGGIFVFPVVGNALMYIIALAIGSIVGAVMLGLLRKPVESK